MSLELRRAAYIALLLAFALAPLAAKDSKKEFTPPEARPAVTYALHDEHTNENVTVAADPYADPAKASIFTVDYNALGFLPVQVIVTNRRGKAISLKDIDVELEMARKYKRIPAQEEDILRRLDQPKRPDSGKRSPLPFPLPHKAKNSAAEKVQGEFERANFSVLAIDSGQTASGFLFFDVAGIAEPLRGAHLYISGIDDGDGNELFFFDIPLEASPAPQP